MTATLPMSERQMQDALMACAKLHGWKLWHAYDARRSEPGFPDLVCVKGFRMVIMELKAAKGRLTVPQREWLEAFRQLPYAEVYVVRDRQPKAGEIDYDTALAVFTDERSSPCTADPAARRLSVATPSVASVAGRRPRRSSPRPRRPPSPPPTPSVRPRPPSTRWAIASALAFSPLA